MHLFNLLKLNNIYLLLVLQNWDRFSSNMDNDKMNDIPERIKYLKPNQDLKFSRNCIYMYVTLTYFVSDSPYVSD